MPACLSHDQRLWQNRLADRHRSVIRPGPTADCGPSPPSMAPYFPRHKIQAPWNHAHGGSTWPCLSHSRPSSLSFANALRHFCPSLIAGAQPPFCVSRKPPATTVASLSPSVTTFFTLLLGRNRAPPPKMSAESNE